MKLLATKCKEAGKKVVWGAKINRFGPVLQK